jgi:endonuclease III
VLRVSNRIGIAEGDDPVKVEAQLCGALPKEMWTLASDVQILHGRRICKPKPLCDRCAVRKDCDYYLSLGNVTGRVTPRGRARAGTHEPRRVRTTRR